MENEKWKMKNGTPRVAIVCDWLVGTGGAERVVLELHKMFPDAPIYTSQYDRNPKIWYGDKWFADADIRTTWLQKLPKGLRKFLPVLRAWAFSRLDLNDYDLVISSSGAEAKGVRTTPKQRFFGKWKMENGKSDVKRPIHICYVHAPTHYYWSRYEQYLKNPGFGALDPLARIGLRLFVGPMRRWDKKASARPDFVICNSSYTKNQIEKYYGRTAEVIHPPVDIERFRPPTAQPSKTTWAAATQGADENRKELNGKWKMKNEKSPLPNPRSGFLTAGRQTPYKRIDLAVAACTKLNLPLTVIGSGPDHEKLVKMAGPTISFATGVPDEDMPLYFQKAEAFLFPGIDDFGIVAVEALAAGTPVIVYGDGGALDYVTPATGLLFTPQTDEALTDCLRDFSNKAFSHETISEYAGNFSADKFRSNMKLFINEAMKGKN